MTAAAKRDRCLAGFAAALAALVSWLLFARGGSPLSLTLTLCICLPALAAGAALYGALVAPYGARSSGYWGAACVICEDHHQDPRHQGTKTSVLRSIFGEPGPWRAPGVSWR
jgi:hypothetical protein